MRKQFRLRRRDGRRTIRRVLDWLPVVMMYGLLWCGQWSGAGGDGYATAGIGHRWRNLVQKQHAGVVVVVGRGGAGADRECQSGGGLRITWIDVPCSIELCYNSSCPKVTVLEQAVLALAGGDLCSGV